MFTYVNAGSFLSIIYALLSTDTMDYLQLGSENIAPYLYRIGQKSVAAQEISYLWGNLQVSPT